MAGSEDPRAGVWPKGERSWDRFVLGPVSIAGDTDGYKIVAIRKIPYDCYVRFARLTTREGSVTVGNGLKMKILDDASSAQTIVAERNVDGDDDAGVQMALTVADAGPLAAGAELQLCIDGDTNCVVNDLEVEVHVQPVRYK